MGEKHLQSTYIIQDFNSEYINKSQNSIIRKLTTQLKLGKIFEEALH